MGARCEHEIATGLLLLEVAGLGEQVEGHGRTVRVDALHVAHLRRIVELAEQVCLIDEHYWTRLWSALVSE